MNRVGMRRTGDRNSSGVPGGRGKGLGPRDSRGATGVHQSDRGEEAENRGSGSSGLPGGGRFGLVRGDRAGPTQSRAGR